MKPANLFCYLVLDPIAFIGIWDAVQFRKTRPRYISTFWVAVAFEKPLRSGT